MIQILFVALTLFSATVQAKPISGFVKTASNRELYVVYDKLPEASAPTVVLLNGLTYSTQQWNAFTKAMLKLGASVLRYDMYGMGNTLLKYAPILNVIPAADQVTDLKELLEKMQIPKPYNLVGLSYGGAIATAFGSEFPELTGKLFLMAPYTRPLEEQDKWIKSQIWYNRQMFPFNPATDDELYDYFLRQIIYSTYPSAEPIAVENPYKLEAIFRMVQGVRKWNAKKAVKTLPDNSVYLMIAEKDQYIKKMVMDEFWGWLPANVKVEQVTITGSEHKMPEAEPKQSAAWIAKRLLN